jgi:hypothetical protein
MLDISKYTWLPRLLQNSVHESDRSSGQSAQRGGFFLSIMGATLLCLVITTPLSIIYSPEGDPFIYIAIVSCLTTLSIILLYLKIGKRVLLATAWFIASAALLFWVDLPITGGTASPDVGWIYMMIAVMCMMTSITLGFVLYIVCTGILFWLSADPTYTVGPMPSSDLYTVTFICQGFFTLLLVVLFDMLRRLTLQESKKRKVDFKHISNQLLSSIDYARRIREGILPVADFTNTPVKEICRWESAKQAISGDFLYSRKQGKRLFVCLADSSGHGVPGGIISALGICFLDEAILGLWMTEPKDILHYIRTQFRNKVRTLAAEVPLDDGMVAAVLCFDEEKQELRVASSQTLVKLKLDTGWQTLAASRYPLSYHPTNHLPFTQACFNLGDIREIFMTTDGVTDQLSPAGKRFTRGRVEDFCKHINDAEPLEKSLDRFRNNLLAWQGDTPQTDDILAVWMRVNTNPKTKNEKQGQPEQSALEVVEDR